MAGEERFHGAMGHVDRAREKQLEEAESESGINRSFWETITRAGEDMGYLTRKDRPGEKTLTGGCHVRVEHDHELLVEEREFWELLERRAAERGRDPYEYLVDLVRYGHIHDPDEEEATLATILEELHDLRRRLFG